MPHCFLSIGAAWGDDQPMKNVIWTKRAGLGLLMGAVACGLVACGGGAATTPVVENPPDVTPTPTPDPEPTPAPDPTPTPAPEPDTGPSADAMRASQTSLIAQYQPVTYTALTAVPASGWAEYDGYLSGTLSNGSDDLTDTIVGDMSLRVGFTSTSATVSGNASNFRDDDNAAMDGSLTFANGSFDRDGNPNSDVTLTFTANGTLTDADGNALAFGTQMEGDFLGDRHNAVGGEVLGRVTHAGTTQNFDGAFIAER